jgi:hypothetical protein
MKRKCELRNAQGAFPRIAQMRDAAERADTMPRRGALAEWLGSGLQSRLQRFESARRLSS